MSSEVEEIKNRLSVVDLIGEYLRLTKAGSNWKALCPFHNEKSPSFMVSEERGSWHCFGCSKGGDIFSFVMEMEGIGFREALEQLAGKAGVELKQSRINDQGSVINDRKMDLYKILELSTKWYEKNLWEGKGKEKILGYLRDRGLSDASIKKFRLGYAPDGWRNALTFLQKRGYSIEDIEKTGLLVKKEKISNEIQNPNDKFKNTDFYDRFRDRIIFPIQDILGRVVGYSARVSPGGDEKSAKYVNTPQTALYDKSKILYGLNFAKVEIKKREEVILVEGNTDVIASHQAGFPNTVAVSGTALTEDQVKILKRYAENLKMGFDMDAAGQTAARRSIKTCLENDLNVKIIMLERGKDAADSLREDPERWKQAVERAKGVMEYYFKEAFSRYDPKKPIEKKKIAAELLNVIRDIANPIEQAHWVRELAKRIDTDEKLLIEVLSRTARSEETGKKTTYPKGNDAGDMRNKEDSLEKNIIGIMLAFPQGCRKELAKIDPEDFQKEEDRVIINTIKQKEENLSLEGIKAVFSDYETRKFLEEAVFEAEVKFGGPAVREQKDEDSRSQLDPIEELRGLIQRIRENRKKEKILQIVRNIKSAEVTGDKAGAKMLMEEFQKLIDN